MVQGNRDVRQDVNDILATREELTEKVELLHGRIRGALWQTKHEIGRSMDEMKQTVAAKDAELRQKQREIDHLYGKLAASSPLTDEELRHQLQDALARVASEKISDQGE